MKTERAFELAGEAKRITETVTGHAHAAVNCMADGPVKNTAKARIGMVKEMTGEFERLTFGLFPLTLEFRGDMPEAELRAWAMSVMEVLRDAP